MRRRRKVYPESTRTFIELLVWWKTRGRCFYCKSAVTLPTSHSLPQFKMIKDHYIPVSRGGADDHSNLVPACKDCDRAKRNIMPWAFIKHFDLLRRLKVLPTKKDRRELQRRVEKNL